MNEKPADAGTLTKNSTSKGLTFTEGKEEGERLLLKTTIAAILAAV